MELTNQTPGTYLGMYAADKLPPASNFVAGSYALVDGAYQQSTGAAWVPLVGTFGLAPTGVLASTVVAASALAGTSLATNVVTSSLTAVGTLAALRVVLTDHVDDAAAATGGVVLNGLYHTAGTVKIRLV